MIKKSKSKKKNVLNKRSYWTRVTDAFVEEDKNNSDSDENGWKCCWFELKLWMMI